jgi:hypothetical protein
LKILYDISLEGEEFKRILKILAADVKSKEMRG